MVEVAIRLPDILKVLGWSDSKFYERRNELLDAGVIFYRWEGKPRKKRVYAFESRLQRYCGIKGSRRETV